MWPSAGSPSELHDYRAAFRAATLPMAVVDHEGLIVTANEALAALTGVGAAALTAQSASDLVDLAADGRTWHAYREVLHGRRSRFRCTRRLKHPDGRSLWAEITVVPMTAAPEQGAGAAPRQVLLSVADVSDRRELQKRLRHLQMHDPVTRLPNRTLFFERLSAVLETTPYQDDSMPGRGRIGLVYLDLDGFKAVNDTLGHRVGDRLLAAVAARLTDCAEQEGPHPTGAHLVARLGGDEFAILVEESTGTQQLTDLARTVLAALQQPFDLAGQRLSVSASIGVVERPVAGTSATGLMQAADTTLYWAKADGKARWTLFDPERNAHRMTRQALSSNLRPAVERGEFTIEYQPLVCMADGVVRGWRRWCAGTTRSSACSRRIGSSRSPRRTARSCSSAAGCCGRPAGRRDGGSWTTRTSRRCSSASTSPYARSGIPTWSPMSRRSSRRPAWTRRCCNWS